MPENAHVSATMTDEERMQLFLVVVCVVFCIYMMFLSM